VDPVLGHQGEIFVSDTSGKLIGIDPETAGQTVIMDNSHGKLGVPFGIALGSNGDVFIANMQAIVCFNRKLGETTTVSAGAKLVVPIWVAMDNDGELFVLNRGVSNNIVAIDRKTGDQTIIAEGFNSPQALVLTKETIYVTDVATPDGNFGVGRIVAVDRQTGAQWEVSKEGLLKRPVGIAVDGKGRLIVGDPYTPHPAQPDLLQGAILRIDPVNGDQEVIAWGQAGFINPRGVAVVPGVRALGKAD
jgi:DNA-binding beta-propeller fold protein YncE